MSTRNTSWGVKAAGAWGWQPYHLSVPIVLKSGSLNLLEISGPVQACTGICFTFLPLWYVAVNRKFHISWRSFNKDFRRTFPCYVLLLFMLISSSRLFASSVSKTWCKLFLAELHPVSCFVAVTLTYVCYVLGAVFIFRGLNWSHLTIVSTLTPRSSKNASFTGRLYWITK